MSKQSKHYVVTDVDLNHGAVGTDNEGHDLTLAWVHFEGGTKCTVLISGDGSLSDVRVQTGKEEAPEKPAPKPLAEVVRHYAYVEWHREMVAARQQAAHDERMARMDERRTN